MVWAIPFRRLLCKLSDRYEITSSPSCLWHLLVHPSQLSTCPMLGMNKVPSNKNASLCLLVRDRNQPHPLLRLSAPPTDHHPRPRPPSQPLSSWTLPSLRRGIAASLCIRRIISCWSLMLRRDGKVRFGMGGWEGGGGRMGTHFPNCLLLYADSFAVQGLMIVSEGET